MKPTYEALMERMNEGDGWLAQAVRAENPDDEILLALERSLAESITNEAVKIRIMILIRLMDGYDAAEVEQDR
jgi:hypothetical protein